LGIERIWIPTVGGVGLGWASLPMTLLWFILLVNAVNIIDGLDALAGGVSIIGLASVIVIGVRTDVPDAIVLALILAGSLAGFLFFNRPAARIFLGDCGSLSLGYFFAVLALWLPIKRYTAVAVYVPILAMLVPLAESGWSILRRTAGRKKPTTPDRGHLHFRLIEHGFSENGVRLLFYGLSAAGFGFSLAVAYGNRRFWMAVFTFFVFLLLGGVYILLRIPRRR
jgi:UDP-GlcNAc:undecaprenyl-phosphate GlcNAc-1-phosphate transferase